MCYVGRGHMLYREEAYAVSAEGVCYLRINPRLFRLMKVR